MKKIGGNTVALIQIKLDGGKNIIGEQIDQWTDALIMKGFLDYSAGQNDVNQYNAKIQDTTHFFFCDFDSLEAVTDDFEWDRFNFDSSIIVNKDGEETIVKITSENCRLIVNGDVYNVLQIDDPMGLHQHLEIYLKYVGGGLGV